MRAAARLRCRAPLGWNPFLEGGTAGCENRCRQLQFQSFKMTPGVGTHEFTFMIFMIRFDINIYHIYLKYLYPNFWRISKGGTNKRQLCGDFWVVRCLGDDTS